MSINVSQGVVADVYILSVARVVARLVQVDYP